MIYTVTFNPSLDYIVTVNDFMTGIVNRTSKEIIFPGGKGINVSMVLKNLGCENTALGFMAGFTGREIIRLLEEKGISTDFIHVAEGTSRINVKLRAQKETEINGQGPAIASADIKKLYEKLDSLHGECVPAIDFDDEVKEIVACKKEYEQKFDTEIPVIVAGGIFDENDIAHALDLGADGVQIASRFVATKECDASEAYKEAYINATEEDVNIIQSPVGMPGRALYNKFIKNMEKARLPISKCYNCLEKCNPQKVPYCITRALIDAVRGDVENGLVFCGANVGRIHEMTTVHQLMKDLTRSFV